MMKTEKERYLSPAVTILMFETEQIICAQSNMGGTEDFTDDREDYGDLFE